MSSHSALKAIRAYEDHGALLDMLMEKRLKLFVPRLPQGFWTDGWTVPYNKIQRFDGDDRPLTADSELFSLQINYTVDRVTYSVTLRPHFHAGIIPERARDGIYDMVLAAVADLRRQAGVVA